MRARAEAASPPEGLPFTLTNLVAPFGRDRRVALRVERMPSRARLSRGRNNGDGSWSLTRDELDGLFYFPPRGSNEIPTLVVRIIGLDSDNGATLQVVDATPGELDDDEDQRGSQQHEAELKKLRAELAKSKASLRATQSDLTEARKTFEVELDERLAEAKAEAAAQAATELEKIRAKWQAEAKERLAKQDMRAEERVSQARESWSGEAQAEIARAEEAWKSGESARHTAAEAQWREQTARAIAEEKAAHAKTQTALAAARKQSAAVADGPKARELRDEIGRLQQTIAERDSKITEAERAASAAHEETTREKEQAARERKEFALKLQDIEARLGDAKASRERSETSETKRLRADLTAAEAKLTEQRRKLAEAQTEAVDARKQADALQSTLAKAEENTKTLEASRLRAAKVEWEAKWRQESERATAALEEKLRNAERALQNAQQQTRTARDRRDPGQPQQFAEEIRTLKSALGKHDLELADARADAKRLRESAKREVELALAESKKEWESGEAARFAEAKAEWEQHSSRVYKKAQIRLEAAEAALAEARSEAGASRDRRDSAEFRRLRAEFAAASAKLADCEAQLAEAQLAAGRARERTREEVEAAVAKAEESWKSSDALRNSEIETRERERGTRALAEAMARLERTEAALTEAKNELETERERVAVQLAEAAARFEKTQTALAEATERIETMRDPANESELHRLRNEIANLQVANTDREAELAVAYAAAKKVRERGSDQVRAAVLRAEDDWRRGEAARLEAAKLDWERQARFAAEMAGAPESVSESSSTRRANRLLLDSALAVAFAAAVVFGVTFYWRSPAEGLSNTAALPPATVHHPAPPVAQSPVSQVTVAALIARIRTAPTTSASVTATLRRGVQVSLLERRGEWARVHVDSQRGKAEAEGWIFAASLRQSPRP
jgi:hypothetical protein